MKAPATPEDEESRLQALRELNILDTEFDNRFDRLTRMAARLFDVPIALVSLVDSDRQWFKSRFGLEAPETPRDISFCGHSILGTEVFTVNNAAKDDRFADNPLVTGDPNIRFYAGCPIQVNDQHRIGTLCIIDNEPRDFPEEDVQILKDLAYMVEQELSAIQLATVDDLTDLTNRRGFMMLGQHSLNINDRQSIPVTVVFIDLDKFKEINDEYGHDEGDSALVLIAEQMKLRFRQSDLMARLGGDEFAVLLNNADLAKAHQTMYAFQQNILEIAAKLEIPYDLSFSYGAVEYDTARHEDLSDLLKEGDELMYQAKRRKH